MSAPQTHSAISSVVLTQQYVGGGGGRGVQGGVTPLLLRCTAVRIHHWRGGGGGEGGTPHQRTHHWSIPIGLRLRLVLGLVSCVGRGNVRTAVRRAAPGVQSTRRRPQRNWGSCRDPLGSGLDRKCTGAAVVAGAPEIIPDRVLQAWTPPRPHRSRALGFGDAESYVIIGALGVVPWQRESWGSWVRLLRAGGGVEVVATRAPEIVAEALGQRGSCGLRFGIGKGEVITAGARGIVRGTQRQRHLRGVWKRIWRKVHRRKSS